MAMDPDMSLSNSPVPDDTMALVDTTGFMALASAHPLDITWLEIAA